MCLGIPMKIVQIQGELGIVELSGTRRKINLQMLPKLKIGDYVIVHAGFAIQKIDEKEAKKALELLR